MNIVVELTFSSTFCSTKIIFEIIYNLFEKNRRISFDIKHRNISVTILNKLFLFKLKYV